MEQEIKSLFEKQHQCKELYANEFIVFTGGWWKFYEIYEYDDVNGSFYDQRLDNIKYCPYCGKKL